MSIKARFLSLICITPLISSAAFCDILGEQLWVSATPTIGVLGELSFKTATDNKGWAISSTVYEKDNSFLPFSDSYTIKSEDRRINRDLSEISVLRFYRANTRYLYADFGFGLGYINGSKEKNCVVQSSFFSTQYRCDEEDVSGLSIPVEVNLAVGRYAGIGITIRTSISKASPGAWLGITFPLGQFTHGNE